jgi:hypothetical protein
VLRELQDRIGAALLTGFEEPVPQGAIAGDAQQATSRFLVHRATVLESLILALGSAFPVCKTRVGDHNFRVLAGSFVRTHPPRRPQLSAYGGAFPAFIDSFGPARRDLPFLPDLARLEWALHEAYCAADAEPLGPEALAAIPQGCVARLRFEPHPATRLIASAEHPIWQLWSADGTPEAAVGEAVLVTRPLDRVQAYAVSRDEHQFLGAMIAGAPLEQAAAAAFAADTGFDLAASLAACFTRGVFSAEVSQTSTYGGVT